MAHSVAAILGQLHLQMRLCPLQLQLHHSWEMPALRPRNARPMTPTRNALEEPVNVSRDGLRTPRTCAKVGRGRGCRILVWSLGPRDFQILTLGSRRGRRYIGAGPESHKSGQGWGLKAQPHQASASAFCLMFSILGVRDTNAECQHTNGRHRATTVCRKHSKHPQCNVDLLPQVAVKGTWYSPRWGHKRSTGWQPSNKREPSCP